MIELNFEFSGMISYWSGSSKPCVHVHIDHHTSTDDVLEAIESCYQEGELDDEVYQNSTITTLEEILSSVKHEIKKILKYAQSFMEEDDVYIDESPQLIFSIKPY